MQVAEVRRHMPLRYHGGLIHGFSVRLVEGYGIDEPKDLCAGSHGGNRVKWMRLFEPSR